MGGHGHRNMYYMTGLPGWMRFGFSPGWVGRSPYGLGPAAQYLMYGTWPTPQMQALWQSGQLPLQTGIAGFPTPYDPWGIAQITPEEELKMLQDQARMLQEQMDQINQRIAELSKEEK